MEEKKKKKCGRKQIYPRCDMVIKSIYLPKWMAKVWDKIGVDKIREYLTEQAK